jgi:hypothetical protein
MIRYPASRLTLAVALAALPLAARADAVPSVANDDAGGDELHGTITCHPVDTEHYVFTSLRIDYELEPIQELDGDLFAKVTGKYELDACYWRSEGTIFGTMTPRIWYGGGFNVELPLKDIEGVANGSAHFSVVRTVGDTHIWLNGPEPIQLECDGVP